MEFQKIIDEIFSKLTGDAEADRKYLTEQSEKYKDHEFAPEILRAIGRKMYELLPDDAKQELTQMIDNQQQSIDSVLEEAIFQLKAQNNPHKAKQLFEAIIAKISGMFKEDAECKYLSFHSFPEKMIYDLTMNPQKNIRQPTYDYATIYYLYGYCLIETKDLDAAEQALLTSYQWNPVSAQTMFELAEVYKTNKQYPEFLEWTNRAIKCTYSAHDLARAYRNLGYYYIDMEEYTLAADLFYFSMMFEDTQIAKSELFYIAEKTGKMPIQSESDSFRAALAEKGIPFGADPQIVAIIYQIAVYLEKEKKYDGAEEYFSLVYGLTRDPKIKAKADEMQKLAKQSG